LSISDEADTRDNVRPVGIRFENFACFDECYLPLDAGIQVLVGKNNAGKTALLRGLTALRGLPIGTTEALPFNLGGYARESAGFSFHVECAFEEGDFALLGDPSGQWPKVSGLKNRLFDFHFRLLAGQNIVGLQGATFTFDEAQVVVLERQSDTLTQHQYNQNGDRVRVIQLRKASNRTIGSENWPIFEPTVMFSALAPLKEVRMIDAHRVARPELSMQAVGELTPNAESLAPFLDTLSGNNRRKFREVEALVTRMFPELEFVNPEKKQNAVFLTLTGRQNDRTIPLTHCGTGVEQVLALAAFVLTAPAGSTLLLDEPHSYLHPSAEREIIAFLLEHSEHRYVISTHSAILINAVSPDKVIAVSSPKTTRTSRQQPPETAAPLHSLGYGNSDFLFSDRLVFVEGESDQEILPILLAGNPEFGKSDITKTGFPKMDGEGRLRSSAKQTSLLYFEKFLRELGRSSLPRMYLFDGDCDDGARQLLRNTPMIAGNDCVAIQFLPRCEIENYLLVPEAIVWAIRHLADIDAKDVSTLSEDAVSKQMQELLGTEDGKLFPNGKGNDPLCSVKGSVVLERVFESHGLKYRKRNEGRLLAQRITALNQAALKEIWDLVRGIFP
jgi:energy-coupling factor transporter ATP-binding protein EcfA2